MFKKFNLVLLIPLLFALLASHRLWRPGYFSMQDDMHVFRLSQFHQCLLDRQIPCRLISDGGLGYSYPLFNFYSPLPYAVAESFHLVGFSLIDSLKISFIIPFFVGSVGMYLLSFTFFGPVGGLISSVLYTFAPYHALDSFVRGALAEHWAINLLPLILYSLYRKKSNLFILSLTALLLSHNLTLVYFLPVLFVFSLIHKNILYLIKNSLYSFLMASFFILPAFLEKNLTTVSTMTQGYFNYIIHFATLYQLFVSRFWGYGASLWGPIDDLSLQVGYLHWILPLIALIFAIRSPSKKTIFTFFSIGLFSLFLTHNRSTFIWQMFYFMPYYQFPWRFLGLAIFCFSFISGIVTKSKFLLVIIIALTVGLNINYFKEDIWYPNLTDSQKLTTEEVYRQSGAGLKDYWPKYSTEFPTTMAPSQPQVLNGEIYASDFFKNSNIASGSINITSEKATINLPIVYFPTWQLTVNGYPSEYQVNPSTGQMQLTLPQGSHQYKLEFLNTPIRTFANVLSLIGLLLFIIKLYREAKS
ncbi:hypothetical protein HYV64_02735 [Candidatus Shapirobacteria bacterium]|nr:hypothetical protein [Candidatus Shapirobacteria bacterium]